MKISRQRLGISQSMDLFIIIAAVLGVGGVVSASIFNLVNSATSNTSIVIVGVSLKAGASQADSPEAISVSVKNNGGGPISCSPTTCQVVFAGTSAGSSSPSCSPPCTITSGGPMAWALGSTNGPLTFQAASAPLPPGDQTSFVLNGPLLTTGASFWVAGSAVTVSAVFGSASAQVTVVSE
jgi:hypothetical protein